MKNKKVLGLIVLVLILVIVGTTNYILSTLSARVDLTAEKLYTLSPGSKSILGKLDRKVTLKFFFSKSAKDLPPSLKEFAEQVQYLLGEYVRAGKGNVVLETYDPKQDSEEEEWAKKYGIAEQKVTPYGAPIYFGLVVACDKQEQTLAGFDSRMESTLEYEISRQITRVVWPERPIVGVLSGIPGVLGEQMNPMMMQMRRRPSPGWIAFSELKKDYDLREIAKDAETIDPDVKALVVIHPKDLSEKTLFAIDQFVIKGGRLIACVDPFSIKDMEASRQQQNPMMQMGGQGGPSTLGKLFDAWGISFDTTKCVADEQSALNVYDGENKEKSVLYYGEDNVLKGDALTAGMSKLIFPYAGALAFTPTDNLVFTPIITTSKGGSYLKDPPMSMYRMDGHDGKPDDVQRTIAARLTGTFKTAFPKGPDWSEGSTNAVPKIVPSGEGSVFLFSDADFIADEVCMQTVETPFGPQLALRRTPTGVEPIPSGNNIDLFANVVAQYVGHKELIGLRARNPSRPFEVVRKLLAEAQKKSRAEVDELQKKIDGLMKDKAEIENEIQEKLYDLLQGKRVNATEWNAIIKQNEEKKKKIEEEVAETTKAQKNIRKNLNADIESLGFRLKVINICLMPLLVILFGIIHAILRRKR